MLKKIAVLSSGGDAPGMNAAIRAVVLGCERSDIEVVGYKYGYNGLLTQNWRKLEARSVHNLIQQGGTVLHSGRCLEFKSEESAKVAAANLNDLGVDGLIVIGGDGSFKGAAHLCKFWNGRVVGLPGTIDNDIAGTDASIGFYTAVQTAVESIDKVRDTADAFERLFLVEVMGRNAGFLALNAAIASASNYAILPELFKNERTTLDEINAQLKTRRNNVGHDSFIIVVAENVWPGGLDSLTKTLSSNTGIEARPVILGHVQRGGAPTSEDRMLATKMGYKAVQTLIEGGTELMIGEQQGQMITHPLSRSWSEQKTIEETDLTTLNALLNHRYL